MRTADQWFDLYGESHINPLNKAIHWVCIPAITWSLLAMLQAIPTGLPDLPFLHVGTVFAVMALGFYLTLSGPIAAGMALGGGLLLVLNEALEAAGAPLVWMALTVFVVAWVLQFIGHWVEGKKPSFFQDLQFLLVGPAWLLNDLYRRAGVYSEGSSRSFT